MTTSPAIAHDGLPLLTRRRKAAIIVQLLLAEGQTPPLSRLTEDAQIALTRALGDLRLVDRETLHAVAEEFTRDLESVGLTAASGMDGALAAIGAHLSPSAAARLRTELASRDGIDHWKPVIALSAAELVPIAQSESTEVCAVLLSKLPVARAAELLALLPGDQARRITFAMSRTQTVSPQAVQRIGRALALEYCTPPETAFDAPPVQRVASILNSSLQLTRDAMLEAMDDDDPGFAAELKRAIFTFGHIPHRITPTDVPKILRGAEQRDLIAALAVAQEGSEGEQAAAEFILTNMSKRMAEQLREEIAARGQVRRSEGEQAMAVIVQEIRAREAAGEITLVQADDGDGP